MNRVKAGETPQSRIHRRKSYPLLRNIVRFDHYLPSAGATTESSAVKTEVAPSVLQALQFGSRPLFLLAILEPWVVVHDLLQLYFGHINTPKREINTPKHR